MFDVVRYGCKFRSAALSQKAIGAHVEIHLFGQWYGSRSDSLLLSHRKPLLYSEHPLSSGSSVIVSRDVQFAGPGLVARSAYTSDKISERFCDIDGGVQ